MTPTQQFRLQRHEGPYERWPLESRLHDTDLDTGQDTGQRVPGYGFEAQYRCGPGFLLVTHYDCPFEEANEFTLLGPRYERLASARLMAPYDSFLLHAHWPVNASTLRLHYQQTLIYDLAIVRGWFGRGHRLVLRRRRDLDDDPEVRRSVDGLKARLAEIAAAARPAEGAGPG